MVKFVRIFICYIIFLFVFCTYLNAGLREARLLGRLYIENNRFENAADILIEQIKQYPDNMGIKMDAAYCYNSLGYWGKALNIYNSVLEMDRHNIEALKEKTIILKKHSGNIKTRYNIFDNVTDIRTYRSVTYYSPLRENYYYTAELSANKYKDFSNYLLREIEKKVTNFKLGIGRKREQYYNYEVNLNYNECGDTGIISGIILLNYVYKKKMSIDLIYRKNMLWDNPVDSVITDGRYNSVEVIGYNSLNNGFFVNFDFNFQDYYLFKNIKYGKGRVAAFGLGKELFSYVSNPVKFNNYANLSLNYYGVRNSYDIKYSNITSLTPKINQLSLNFDFGYELNGNLFLEAGFYNAHDRTRQLNFFKLDSYGINVKITGYITPYIHSYVRYEYGTESNFLETGKSSNLNIEFKFFY